VSRNINIEFERESENPRWHDSHHNTARTEGGLAALPHWLSKDSPPADPLDLEVQHSFQRKDDDTAEFETGPPTTHNGPITNENAWSLIVARLNIQTWRESAQSFIYGIRHQPSIIQIMKKKRTVSARWVEPSRRTLLLAIPGKLHERSRVSFPEIQSDS